MTTETTYAEKLNQRFRDLAPTLPGAGLDWLADRRRHGMAAFQSAGFPSQRVEAWKYTNLNSLKKADYVTAATDTLALTKIPPPPLVQDGQRLVFVNGCYRADLSQLDALPAGLTVASSELALASGDEELRAVLQANADSLPFSALNGAFMNTGFVIRLAAGVVIEAPLEILSIYDDANKIASHGRNLVLLSDGASLQLIERQLAWGESDYFANTVTHVGLGEGAKLRHFRHQDEALAATQIATVIVDIAADGGYDNFTLSTGGRLARNEIHVALNAPGANVRLDGAYMATGKQHCDTTTVISHRAADTHSTQTYKGVLAGSAQAVFAGRIMVEKDAQRITGQQLSRALLLSDKAQVNAKPELRIFADDVKCSHGATVGELAEDALFYLRARGIPEAEARQLLIAAFVAEIIESVEIPAARELATKVVAAWQHSTSDGEMA